MGWHDKCYIERARERSLAISPPRAVCPAPYRLPGIFLPVKCGPLSVPASAFICQYYLDCRHYLDGILIVPTKFVIAATIYAFFNYGFGLGLPKGILPLKK